MLFPAEWHLPSVIYGPKANPEQPSPICILRKVSGVLFLHSVKLSGATQRGEASLPTNLRSAEVQDGQAKNSGQGFCLEERWKKRWEQDRFLYESLISWHLFAQRLKMEDSVTKASDCSLLPDGHFSPQSEKKPSCHLTKQVWIPSPPTAWGHSCCLASRGWSRINNCDQCVSCLQTQHTTRYFVSMIYESVWDAAECFGLASVQVQYSSSLSP